MNQVKVSIIIPVYNTEKYLRKCVESVLNQTLKDIEIILVNDGSTDNSPKICDEYKADNRVIVIHQENSGPASARNAGLAIAKGEYIGFVDSDDYIQDSMYETLVNTADTNNCDIVNCGYYEVNSKGEIIRLYDDTHGYKANILISAEKLFDRLKNIHADNLLWFAVRNIYRKSFIKENKISFCEEDVVEDPLFNLDCFLSSPTMVFLDKPLYYYVLTDDSLTRKKGKVGYTKHLENTYNNKIEKYKNNGIVGYKKDFDLYTISHTIPLLISNLLQLEFEKDEFNDFINSNMIADICYSNCRNIKDKLLIFLLKHKMKKVLFVIFKLYFKV